MSGASDWEKAKFETAIKESIIIIYFIADMF
jgi:hypothetical protein